MPSSSASARSTAIPTSTPPPSSPPRCNCAHAPKSSSPARFPASKATSNPSPPGSWPACTPPRSLAARPRAPCRALPPSARSATTSPRPTRRATSPPTSPSTCCRNSTRPHAPATRKRATPWCAGRRSRRWKSTDMPASELERQIALYLGELARAGNSAHSIRAYEADLRQFLAYLSPPDLAPPAPQAIDLLLLREWLASLYRDQLATVTLRRKLATVRGLFRFMLREGVVPLNVARLVRTPKAPRTLPDVMTAEQVNALLDGVAARRSEE